MRQVAAQSAGDSRTVAVPGIRAQSGEKVGVVIDVVKADRKQQFEEVLAKIAEAVDKLGRSDPEVRRMNAQTRVLRPAAANPDGTYTFMFLADPVVPGADYRLATLFTKAFGKSESDRLLAEFAEAHVQRQQSFELVQADR